MKILLTGRTGFIGSHLLKALNAKAQAVSLRDSAWPMTLASHRPTALVHLAGYTHARASEDEIRRVNVGGTMALAEEAVRLGVRRFIFLSSIKAVAKKTAEGESVRKNTSAAPQGAYERSKLRPSISSDGFLWKAVWRW